MQSPLKVILPVSAVLLGLPASALADPAISVDRPCYANPSQRADTIRMTGTGFTPGAAFQVTVDGRPLVGATATTAADGTLTAALAVPRPALGAREQAFVLGVQEGTNTATAPLSVARLVATFAPAAGDPARLRVRFAVAGFSLSGRTAPPVFLHYVRPDGRLLHTVRVGTAGGPCGSLSTTLRRRLFPFRAPAGTWRLQFDTARTYRRGTARSAFLFYTVTVRIRAR